MRTRTPHQLIRATLASLLALCSAHTQAASPQAPFDYYLLSLSWSPTYCLTHAQDQNQCGKGYGFVLHGLWPQYQRGGYPQNCPTSDQLTREAIAYGVSLFPSPNLIRHEWDKHGTCSGMSALGYFKTADKALASIQAPQAMQAPVKPLFMPAKAIAAAFRQANPTLPVNSVVVNCSGPELAEVRVCLNKALSPTACGRAVSSNCRPGNIRIPSVR